MVLCNFFCNFLGFFGIFGIFVIFYFHFPYETVAHFHNYFLAGLFGEILRPEVGCESLVTSWRRDNFLRSFFILACGGIKSLFDPLYVGSWAPSTGTSQGSLSPAENTTSPRPNLYHKGVSWPQLLLCVWRVPHTTHGRLLYRMQSFTTQCFQRAHGSSGVGLRWVQGTDTPTRSRWSATTRYRIRL